MASKAKVLEKETEVEGKTEKRKPDFQLNALAAPEGANPIGAVWSADLKDKGVGWSGKVMNPPFGWDAKAIAVFPYSNATYKGGEPKKDPDYVLRAVNGLGKWVSVGKMWSIELSDGETGWYLWFKPCLGWKGDFLAMPPYAAK